MYQILLNCQCLKYLRVQTYDLGTFTTLLQVSTCILDHLELYIQSTLVISKSKGPSKTVRDIRTSTYQICSIEEKKQFEQPIFTNDYVI